MYNREDVLGRDVATVFPTAAKKASADANAQAFKALFGEDRKFVTESEVGRGAFVHGAPCVVRTSRCLSMRAALRMLCLLAHARHFCALVADACVFWCHALAPPRPARCSCTR